jgi:hypothetical protein
MQIKVSQGDIARLAQELERLDQVRFDAVALKSLTEIRNRAVASGGTPIGDYSGNAPGYEKTGGELRKSVMLTAPTEQLIARGEVGYTAAYAPHVEYGHRQTPGRFVPAIGKRLKADYVPGQHFLRENVERQRFIFREDLKKALNGVR